MTMPSLSFWGDLVNCKNVCKVMDITIGFVKLRLAIEFQEIVNPFLVGAYIFKLSVCGKGLQPFVHQRLLSQDSRLLSSLPIWFVSMCLSTFSMPLRSRVWIPKSRSYKFGRTYWPKISQSSPFLQSMHAIRHPPCRSLARSTTYLSSSPLSSFLVDVARAA